MKTGQASQSLQACGHAKWSLVESVLEPRRWAQTQHSVRSQLEPPDIDPTPGRSSLSHESGLKRWKTPRSRGYRPSQAVCQVQRNPKIRRERLPEPDSAFEASTLEPTHDAEPGRTGGAGSIATDPAVAVVCGFHSRCVPSASGPRRWAWLSHRCFGKPRNVRAVLPQ